MISSTQTFICKEILLLKKSTNKCTNNSAARASTQNVGVSSAHYADWIPYRSDIHEPWQLSAWLRRHPAEVSQKCWTSRTVLGQLAMGSMGGSEGMMGDGLKGFHHEFRYLFIFIIYILFIYLFIFIYIYIYIFKYNYIYIYGSRP